MKINNIKNAAGYTLIELLTVVAIIGILASIAIPNYRGYRDKAKMVSIYATLHNVRLLQEVYWTDNESFFNYTDGIEFPVPKGQTYLITTGDDGVPYYHVLITTEMDRNQDGEKDKYKFQHWTTHEDISAPLFPIAI